MNWVKKVVSFFRTVVTRPGLPEFIAKWVPRVREIIADELAEARATNPQATLKDVIFPVTQRVTEETKTPYDNWVVLVIAHAYEAIKAK